MLASNTSAQSGTCAMNDASKGSSQERSGTDAPSGDGVKQEQQDQNGSDRKRTRCQEKNRRAQARFRERQKAKAAETDQKMASLEDTVKRLQEERASLQSPALSLPAQVQQPAQQSGALPRDGEQPASAAPPLHGVGSLDGQADYTQMLADTRTSGTAGVEVVLPSVTPMAWDNYVVFYKDQIHRMAPLLAPAQAAPSGEAAQTCERLLTELSETNRAIFHRNPALRDKVHTQPLVEASDEPRVQPDVALWRQVTAALQMTPAQKQHARTLHQYYWGRMRDIMSERQRLSMAMLATCELPPDIIQAQAAAPWKPWHQNQDVASKHSQALETITALNKNIAEETLAQIEVGHGLFCKVLTPLQACSAYVGLYPFFPDKLAILSCVLELDESEDAVRSLVTELIGS